MKKAIFAIMIGQDPSYPFVYQSFKKYADRVDADLICTTTFNYGHLGQSRGFSFCRSAWLEKTHIKTLLEKYDRVLYLDADILITPNAPDIFSVYPDTNTIYMLNEGLYSDREKQISQISALLPLENGWPRNEEQKPYYYNGGVMLMSKDANLFNHVDMDEFLSLHGKVSLYDQTYFSYLIAKHNLKAESIDIKFNRMDIFGHENYREKSYFIHYAGGGYCTNSKLRYRTVIDDYMKLYNEPSSAYQKFIFKLRADAKFLSHQVVRNLNKLVK
ncbi:MAG: glycosyltransferase [Gammaproteobacteria bacterium]|nr:glycosyltransferase [Gammaproteobacteria bacterium]